MDQKKNAENPLAYKKKFSSIYTFSKIDIHVIIIPRKQLL